MELIGKLTSNDTPNIGILPSASKEASIKISDKCIRIINERNRSNGLKFRKKFKRDNQYSNINQIIYNIKVNSDVNHKVMQMKRNNKLFT